MTFHSMNRVAQARQAAVLALWGWWLVNGMAFATAPLYRVMAQVASEQVWGTLALAIAAINMIGLWRMWGGLCQVSVFLAVLYWSFVTIGAAMSSFATAGWILTLGITLTTAHLFVLVYAE